MSQDGQTPADHSFLARPFVWGTRLILAYPVATIAVSIGFALVALALSWTRLGYRTSRLDLLNPKSDYNRLWLEYVKEFGEADDAVIVVEGSGRDQVVPVLEELSSALAREDRLFHAVLHEVDLSKIRAKGLHDLSPEELTAIDGFLAEAQPIVAGDWSRLNIGNMASGMMLRMQAAMQAARRLAAGHPAGTRGGTGLMSPAARAGWPRRLGRHAGRLGPADLERLTSSLLATLSQRGVINRLSRNAAAIRHAQRAEFRLSAGQGRATGLRAVAVGYRGQRHAMTGGSEATDALRSLIAQVQARHRNTKIGLTGLPIMESDEMRSSQSSMFWSSFISLIGVGILFIAGFGGIRHACWPM